MEEEIWKDIPGYEGLYQVSNFGRVKSMGRVSFSGPHYSTKRKYPSKVLKHRLICGYPKVPLCKDGIVTDWRVHRLVLLAFIGESDLECNHKDGNRSNNNLNNLEYCTRSENVEHACRTGLWYHRGEKSPTAKLYEKDVINIRNMYKSGKYSMPKLSKMFGIGCSQIYRIIRRESWKHI